MRSVSSNYMQTNPMMGGARGEGVVVEELEVAEEVLEW
jgi:hypothetical protein